MPVQPYSESSRLAALHRYDILDSPPEAAFDEITELTSVLFNAPIAVINFVDQHRQWFKSERGLGVRETPLETSFCVHALLQEDVMVVPDTAEDERFIDNPLVTSDPGFRFYAGALLKSDDGLPLGTLCLLDHKPRQFSPEQQHALRVMANQVMAQLEQRRLLKESEANREQMARLIRQLQDRDQSKNEFLAMISHELRNPLSPIVTTLDLLSMRGPHDPLVERGLLTIRRQSQHLIRLVDDLLDASRVATGKISLARADFPLSNAVQRAVEIVQSAIAKKQQTLHINLPEQPVILHADEVRISQVLTNLLTNAVRYTPEEGSIWLRAELLPNESLKITVADNGRGLSADFLERIFESFVQVPQGGRGSGGLGIGLHLCKHIVSMHGGSIWAESEGEGRGSAFMVKLPLAPGSGNQ